MGQLEEMSVFVRIVDAGGIGKAADQLGMAKSGISRRLVALEKRLGVTLINRTTRSASLTSAGRQYYEAAVKLLGDVAELNAMTSDAETAIEGHLRLAVPLSFGLCHLSSALEAFSCLHPGLTFNIDFSDRQIDLIEQGMDLAIRIANLKDSSLKARRICPIRMVICASPQYLEKQGRPERPSDLRQHQVLSYDIGGGSTLRLTDGKGGEEQVQIKPRMIANNGDFLRDMAVAGHGIVLLPTFIAYQALAGGELIPLMKRFTPPPLSAWAVYPQTRYLSQRARLLINFLLERFGEEPYWDKTATAL